jgi:hypothetical protein
MKRLAKLISLILACQNLFFPSWSHAAISVTSNLAVSLDSISASNFSGTTWSSQDGTSYNATLQSAGQYDSANHIVTMNDTTTPNYASLGKGSSGDAINKAGDLSVEVWAKFNHVHTTAWNIVATKWFTGPSTNSSCTNQTFHFGLKLGVANIYTTGAGGQNLSGTTTVTDNTWHQLVFTMINPSDKSGSSLNTNGTLSLYLDGALENSVTGLTVYQVSDPGCELLLGDGRSSGSLGIDGGLEKFRLYNKALTAAEVNQNYRADAQNINHTMPAGPYATLDPVISGPATYTKTETGTSGTWINGVTSYSYQWSRSATSTGSYTAISGATAQAYVTASADVGNYLKLTVGATNASGTFYDTSIASPQISKAGITMGLTVTNQLPFYRSTNNISASTGGQAGKVSFTLLGKAIPGCKSIASNVSNSYTATCPWKPSQHGLVSVIATFTPTDSNYLTAIKTLGPVAVSARSGNR